MQAELNPTEAAARLQTVRAVRRQVRAAALAPSLVLAALGGVAVVHGALATPWPHTRALTVVWLAALVAVRPGLRWLRVRAERRRGLQTRLRLVGAAAAVAVCAAAVAAGADPLIGAVAAAAALVAIRAGAVSVAAAVVAVALVADVLIAGAGPRELAAGAGLLAAALMSRLRERSSAA